MLYIEIVLAEIGRPVPYEVDKGPKYSSRISLFYRMAIRSKLFTITFTMTPFNIHKAIPKNNIHQRHHSVWLTCQHLLITQNKYLCILI